jgi:hypothetical protein
MKPYLQSAGVQTGVQITCCYMCLLHGLWMLQLCLLQQDTLARTSAGSAQQLCAASTADAELVSSI